MEGWLQAVLFTSSVPDSPPELEKSAPPFRPSKECATRKSVSTREPSSQRQLPARSERSPSISGCV